MKSNIKVMAWEWLMMFLVLGSSWGQQGGPGQTPCPDVCRYSWDENAGQWNALITIIPPILFAEIRVDVKLTTMYNPQHYGSLSIYGDNNELSAIAQRVYNHQQQLIRFLIDFPRGQARPRISSILINGKEFCPKDQNICGISVVVSSRIIDGLATQHGQWPWIAAMFMRMQGEEKFQFTCGGSLIDEKHVLTAGHCIKSGRRTFLTPDNILIKLGAYDITDWTEPHSQRMEISGVHVHPKYDADVVGKGSDIAVLTFKVPATFSAYVTPICLWNSNVHLENVVGMKGTVVGWGRYGFGDKVSNVPMEASGLTIVSQEKCRRSHPEFQISASQTSFCAGNRDDSGPCKGDSGSGFVMSFKVNGRYRWYWKGLVSTVIVTKVNTNCDLSEYVTYTDVKQFTSWIQNVDLGSNPSDV